MVKCLLYPSIVPVASHGMFGIAVARQQTNRIIGMKGLNLSLRYTSVMVSTLIKTTTIRMEFLDAIYVYCYVSSIKASCSYSRKNNSGWPSGSPYVIEGDRTAPWQ